MKWIIFTGTWRLTNKEVEYDVRQAARAVFERGDGIVTGGATGVDYFAMDEFVKLNPECTRIRVFIPARLEHFIADYRKNWKHDPIGDQDIESLHHLLKLIKERNPSSVYEVRKESGDITQEEYDLRHNEEVAFSDEVYAFHVNKSGGTSDTIEKATAAGLAISLHKKYQINLDKI
jgi:CO dehydrogenase/acetyl-CoA synthase beta subunit